MAHAAVPSPSIPSAPAPPAAAGIRAPRLRQLSAAAALPPRAALARSPALAALRFAGREGGRKRSVGKKKKLPSVHSF